MKQLITPNPYIPCKPGWCLAYVNQAFGGVPIRYGSATAAWNGSATKHRDWNFPNAWVPLYFSLLNEPNGHVALRAPDGRVFSTTHPTSLWPTEHPNLAHLFNAYARYNPLTFLGWTEDIEGTPVVSSLNLASTGTITPLEEGFLMALSEEEQRRILAAADRINGVVTDPKAKVLTTNDMAGIADAVLGKQVPWYGFDGNRPKDGRTTTTLALATGYTDAGASSILGTVAALTELVKQLSIKQGVTIDYAAIAQAVNDDAAKRMRA